MEEGEVMGKCDYGFGVLCDAISTTTLKKSDGAVVQLCEQHYDLLIKVAKRIADGEEGLSNLENPEARASHWLVKNRIPS